MVRYLPVRGFNAFEVGLVFALCAACFYELHIGSEVPIALTFSRWFILIAAACLLGGQPRFERAVEWFVARYT